MHRSKSYNAFHVQDQVLQPLLQHCHNLVFFGLSHAPITNRSMETLGAHCHQLVTLHLENCPRLDTDLFHAICHCHRLEEITIISCDLVGGAEITQHLVGFQQLTRLKSVMARMILVHVSLLLLLLLL
ncbi:unnamed protein product [Absidia cylindrospora]